MRPALSNSPVDGPDETTPHVLVVDDDWRIRELLKRYLEEQGLRVTTARNVVETERRMAGLEFDLVVLDVMMPGEDGLSFASRLKRASHIPILMLTARAEAESRIDGFERGVDDYLGKPFEPRELLLRIQSILRRVRLPDTVRADTSPYAVWFGPFSFNVRRGDLTESGQKIYLTTGESRLLQQLAQAPGRVFSREALCAAGLGASERSIDVQVTRLRRKIEEDPRKPAYLQTVRNAGYILKPDRMKATPDGTDAP